MTMERENKSPYLTAEWLALTLLLELIEYDLDLADDTIELIGRIKTRKLKRGRSDIYARRQRNA